ncbi:MAG: hypothetical protein WAX14_10285 [Rhodococcus sp. (in: high G+C Gram-positive bacteria)]|uniref:hypothetical protein n=1 Tax=Rhodococcus sp. TaxID=1831 RepID=UPI003BB7E92A
MIRNTAAVLALAALTLFVGACGDDETTTTSTTTTTTSATTTTTSGYEGEGAVMQDPQGGTGTVPCEGTICTNPNHGAGS